MPLYFKQTNPIVGIWKMTESIYELENMLNEKALSSPSIIQDIHSESRKKERIAALVLLKELLGYETIISHNENGAPFLPEDNINISITHTKGYVAIILDKKNKVGIDIEYISERVKKIRKRFISSEEDKNIDTNYETEHLLIHWCAKETLFKVINCMEVDFTKHLHIQPFIYDEEGTLYGNESRTNRHGSYKLKFIVDKEFILTYTLCE